MQILSSPVRWWVGAWLVLSLLGAALLARQAIETERALFETDARIVHRLLSQATVQHDAILATLTLMPLATDVSGVGPLEQRLLALYPHILAVQRRDHPGHWNELALDRAEAESLLARQAALVLEHFAAGRYQLVLAASPTSYAMTIDLRAMVELTGWPMNTQTSPVRVVLVQAGQQYVVQPGSLQTTTMPLGWRMDFQKHLAAASQPFDVVAVRHLGWGELPWWRMLAWVVGVGATLITVWQMQRQRTQRRRAEELLRLGQVARLNTLGELAAGLAHELNQPLTAVLASTQAAQRLLKDDPPELETVRVAMTQAAAQARRAADVVSRLRRAIERPDASQMTRAIHLKEAVQRVLHLLEPECQQRAVTPRLTVTVPVIVQVDPVALEQVIHNLLMNALQALEHVDTGTRTIDMTIAKQADFGMLTITDNGPGISPDALVHLFEPFFSTREGGLGLGLNLCETLAHAMGGTLTGGNATARGAVFTLLLPLNGAVQ